MVKEKDPLLTVYEVHEILGVPRSTCDQWRRKSLGPRTIRIPNEKLRFRFSDIEDWLEGLAVDDPETIRLK